MGSGTTSNNNYTASLQDRINYGTNKDLWDNVRKEMGLRPDQTGKSATTKMAQYVLSQGNGLGGGGSVTAMAKARTPTGTAANTMTLSTGEDSS